MSFVSQLKLRYLILLALLLLSLLAVQAVLVSATISLAKSDVAKNAKDLNSNDLDADNVWLHIAKALSFSNPDVFALEARALRSSAVVNWDSQDIAQLYLEQSLSAWQQAISLRPQWPYYQLAALDVEVLMNVDAVVIQQRFQQIITLAPNERGMDKALLELALFNWPKLLPQQQEWVVARLAIVPSHTLRKLYDSAKAVGREQLLCTFLPWNKVKQLCLK